MHDDFITTDPQELPNTFVEAACLSEQIKGHYQAIRSNENSFDVLHENISRLENLIFTAPTARTSDGSVLKEISNDERAYLNKAYCRWETETEYRFACSVISGQETSLKNYLLNKRFERLLERELALLSDTPPTRILFIGSGPMPISAFHLHLMTGRPVDCLDANPDAVTTAQQVIDKLGFKASFQVLSGAGEDFDVSRYDLILIALLAKPKHRILRNLRKHAAPGCRVLCRTSFGLRTLLYEPTPKKDLRGFRLMSTQVAARGQTISTFLLKGSNSFVTNVGLRWLTTIDDGMAVNILRLMNRILETENTIGFPGPLDDLTGAQLMEQLKEDVETQRRHVLIAEIDGMVVGQVILTPHHLPNCKHLVELSRGIIDPSFRGAGLLLRAFKEIVGKCEELGCEVIYLDVRAGTLAAGWWRAFGFNIFGTLPEYARVDGVSYSGHYMSQKVSSLKKQIDHMSDAGRKG